MPAGFMQSLTSFYRQYLRQVRRLPHHYLRLVSLILHHIFSHQLPSIFFQIKASDDFRAICRTPPQKAALRTSKIKRVFRVRWLLYRENISVISKQDLRKIEQALGGRHDAFAHILNLAYGRKGKLKWELMQV